uniref:G-protein coupled receptors family 1 profile domain-containing protein n=3 Tax=Octopus bimaculoides TaxID=37653 RepID=A0A0L8GNE3_OCTBM
MVVLFHIWLLSPIMCTLVSFLQVFSVTMSSSTNIAIAIDRLIAVLFPLRIRITSSRSSCTIALIWLFSVAIASAELFVARAAEVYFQGDIVKVCVETWEKPLLGLIYWWLNTVCLCFIPFIVLMVTYSILVNVLWKRRAPGNEDTSRDQLAIRAKRKVVKMLLTIVVMFGVCWTPLGIIIMFLEYNNDLVFTPGSKLMSIYIALHWLAMAHSSVNPIIYGFMNDNFRDDLKGLFKKLRLFSSVRSASTEHAP